METEVVINGTGVSSLIAAHHLQKLGYNVTIPKSDKLPYSEIEVYLRGTLFGVTTITGDSQADTYTLRGFESSAKTEFPKYYSGIATTPAKRRLFSKPASVHKHTQKHFTTKEIHKLVQFPFVLLGLNPYTTVASPLITIDAQQPSSRLIAIRIQLKRGYRKKLASHSVIISQNWDAHIKGIFNTSQWPGDPTMYVGSIGNKELLIEVPVPENALYNQQELDRYADWIIDCVSKTLHLNDLANRIAQKEVIGPKTA